MQQNGATSSVEGNNNSASTSPLPPPRKLTEAASSTSITSARGGAGGSNVMSEVGSTLGTTKDYSSLSAFNSFLNNSVFPLEDLNNVAQALKPPEKNNIPVSSSQKGPSVFSRFTKRINVRFKGKTFLEIPTYPFVNSDNETEQATSKSPTNAGTRSKPSSAQGKRGPPSRPSSSSKKTQQQNSNNTTTSSNTSQTEEDSIQKLWEHRFVYFLVSNFQANSGQTEMHHTLIESQDFLIEKEHCVVFETLQDLVYYESCPFVSFLIRREFDPSLPSSSVAEKKKNGLTNTNAQKKDATAINPPVSNLAKKDSAPLPPGLPTPSTTKKIQTAITASTPINEDELIESMIQDIKSAFGTNCEILHTFKTCTLPLFVNDKFGFTKSKYEQKHSNKYKNWSSLLCRSDTLNIGPTSLMDESFKSETLSSSRFSMTQVPTTHEASEILNHINVRIEVAEGTSILSEEVQNKLNPVLISISSLKDLPNEKYLADRCKPVSISFNIRGKTFRTNGYEHASFISLNYKRVIYLGSNSEMEMYREYFSRMPIVFEVHDRDPKEGVGKFFGKAEVSLKTMILNSRGREVSDNFQIQGVCMLPDEYEKAVKRLEEEKKRVAVVEEEKKAKASSKSPKNKNSKTNLLESPKVPSTSANTEVFPVEYTIFEGKYVEKKSSVKIQMRFNNPFPAYTETEKSIYPVVLTFPWDNIALVQKVEQLFTQYFTRPTPSKSMLDLFGPVSPVGTSNFLGSASLSPESAESPQVNTSKGNKDFLKYFCGFEICDGRKRLLTVEVTSKDALRFFIDRVENYCNKESLPVKIMYDFSCFYSNRLYEQLIGVSSKSGDKVEEKKGAGRRPSMQVIPVDDTKKGITRLRLQDTFENILSSKEIYIKNKKAEDLKILAALSKVYSIFSSDSIEQVIENGLLPDSCNLMSIKERFCDDNLIDVDNLLVMNQRKKKSEDEEMQKTKRETEHEEIYSAPETIDDLGLHLNEEVGLEGIPLIETPAHLPPAEKIIFEGEEKRKKARVRAFNTNPSGYTLEEVSQPEKKFWIYIPHLKGHIVAAFPPMTKEFPPFNLHSYMTGTLIRSDRKHPPPKIRAYTNFGSISTKSRKPEITISPDIVYCIMVNSWTQRASTQIDNKLDYKLRQSMRSPTSKNFMHENFQTVHELSRHSSNSKFREEMEKSSKKYITIPTYPEERKNLEKTLELRQTTPPSQPWVNRGKTTSREDNRHPKQLDQARIDELHMIDLFDKNLSTMLRESSTTSLSAAGGTSKRTGNGVTNFTNPSLSSVKLPKIK